MIIVVVFVPRSLGELKKVEPGDGRINSCVMVAYINEVDYESGVFEEISDSSVNADELILVDAFECVGAINALERIFDPSSETGLSYQGDMQRRNFPVL